MPFVSICRSIISEFASIIDIHTTLTCIYCTLAVSKNTAKALKMGIALGICLGAAAVGIVHPMWRNWQQRKLNRASARP